ncbi:hypothetical protein COU54_05610 [Candidatus Pacearchaeota archaeon CG10_big_fil_rev_8_21_14_0_10_31_24]|nr:MAG: hypothetical protein COU54_05610 [Candidatus Pacearchaeota archaeon CG10_big_fil_rev_8_21_14_0_10_31_24]
MITKKDIGKMKKYCSMSPSIEFKPVNKVKYVGGYAYELRRDKIRKESKLMCALTLEGRIHKVPIINVHTLPVAVEEKKEKTEMVVAKVFKKVKLTYSRGFTKIFGTKILGRNRISDDTFTTIRYLVGFDIEDNLLYAVANGKHLEGEEIKFEPTSNSRWVCIPLRDLRSIQDYRSYFE